MQKQTNKDTNGILKLNLQTRDDYLLSSNRTARVMKLPKGCHFIYQPHPV